MSIYIYRSTDTSAPVLNGQAGTFINVLDACLVNGYGVKSPMGQTKEFSATNLAAYRMPAGTSRMYLAVDDNGTNTCKLRGFFTMNSIWQSTVSLFSSPVGTRPFPNEYQLNGGTQFYKSYTTNGVARPQVLISNGKLFYFFADCNSDGSSQTRVMAFGDIASYIPNDPNPCIIIGSHTDNYNYFPLFSQSSLLLSHFLAQRQDGNSYSTPVTKMPINGAGLNFIGMGQQSQLLAYPDPLTGNMQMSPVAIWEIVQTGEIVPRGRLSGLQSPLHPNTTMATGDTVSGKAGTSLEGRTFEAFRSSYYGGPTPSLFLLETSDTWDTVNFGRY